MGPRKPKASEPAQRHEGPREHSVAAREAREVKISEATQRDEAEAHSVAAKDGGPGEMGKTEAVHALNIQQIAALRAKHVGGNVGTSYTKPLHVVRGRGCYLYDADGTEYLDAYNNIAHVGHAHPRVTAAATRQLAKVNTNTRYLDEGMAKYAQRLAALFPAPLSVVYFVCSGTEANDLALRMAWTATGRRDVLVVDHAYHGHSPSMIDLSPYKHNRKGGQGPPDWVHAVPWPNPLRRPLARVKASPGAMYARDVEAEIGSLKRRGRRPAAFFVEGIPGCAGQLVLPQHYLRDSFAYVRAAGGLCVVDEVQVGFGRVGEAMWSFQLGEVVPDIVTLGKPMGNGYPMAAVVTTPAVAAAFDNGMEFFSSFAGTPVTAAVGMAVLDVLEDEGLQAQAVLTGAQLREGLNKLKDEFPFVVDVRGVGLFWGIELAHPLTGKACAKEASWVVNYLKDKLRILVGTDGPEGNVIKLKPPMVFGPVEADRFIAGVATAFHALTQLPVARL